MQFSGTQDELTVCDKRSRTGHSFVLHGEIGPDSGAIYPLIISDKPYFVLEDAYLYQFIPALAEEIFTAKEMLHYHISALWDYLRNEQFSGRGEHIQPGLKLNIQKALKKLDDDLCAMSQETRPNMSGGL